MLLHQLMINTACAYTSFIKYCSIVVKMFRDPEVQASLAHSKCENNL